MPPPSQFQFSEHLYPNGHTAAETEELQANQTPEAELISPWKRHFMKLISCDSDSCENHCIPISFISKDKKLHLQSVVAYGSNKIRLLPLIEMIRFSEKRLYIWWLTLDMKGQSV